MTEEVSARSSNASRKSRYLAEKEARKKQLTTGRQNLSVCLGKVDGRGRRQQGDVAESDSSQGRGRKGEREPFVGLPGRPRGRKEGRKKSSGSEAYSSPHLPGRSASGKSRVRRTLHRPPLTTRPSAGVLKGLAPFPSARFPRPEESLTRPSSAVRLQDRVGTR